VTRPRPRAVLHHLAVYALFVALVVAYTLPLIQDLGGHLRPHPDPRSFTWVLGWGSHALASDPARIFHGNIFYPHGDALAYSEPLFTALPVFAPVYYATGNPILAYNVTMIILWALSGWATYAAALTLTQSPAAALVGALAFTLSPYRIGYYGIITMQLTFPIPLALLFFARFLEHQRGRDLLLAFLFVWLQALAVWYYAIPLGLLLGVFALLFLLLRWRGWRWATWGWLLGGGLLLGACLLPVAWPYVEARQQLGFERSLEETALRPADLLSYLDAGPEHRFYRLAYSARYPVLFPGFTVLLLAAVSLLWLRSDRASPLPGWVRRLPAAVIAATAAVTAIFLVTGGGSVRLAGLTLQMTELDRAIWVLLAAGVAALLLTGWARARTHEPRALTSPDWVRALLYLTTFFVAVSLGPVMYYAGQEVGDGIYAWLYEWLPPLRAIRIPLRLGALSLFLLGLLAAFGLAWVHHRLAGRRWLQRALFVVPLLLAVEYLPNPLAYDQVRWDHPRPVYRFLAAQPGDFAVLEWPTGDEDDSEYLLWSLLHRKRLVHGISGFVPGFTWRVQQAAWKLPADPPLPLFRSIYPLRYLIVHAGAAPPEERDRWERLGTDPPPGLGVVGRFGDSLVLELLDGPEGGRAIERAFAYDVVTDRRTAHLALRAAGYDPRVAQQTTITFNDRPLAQIALTKEWTRLTLRLRPPFRAADRNVLRLVYGYTFRTPPVRDPRYRIGRTGVTSPVDLVVVSAANPYGNVASILVNGRELATEHRGYQVVALDPASGAVLARKAFDTFFEPGAAGRLAAFLRTLPHGTLVAATIKDEGVGLLTDEAVAAFRELGGSLDPRGALWTSHLLIGVKGARPGTAVEAVGQRRLERVVGVDRRELQMVMKDFRLE